MTMDTDEAAALLVDAARYGEEEEVAEGLRSGAPASAADASGRSALHMASANGHASVAKVLLESGADANAKNKEGSTPLHWACLNGHAEIVELLLEAGAKVSAVNESGRTPYDEAMQRPDHDGIVACLDAHEKAHATAAGQTEVAVEDPEHNIEDVEEFTLDGAKS